MANRIATLRDWKSPVLDSQSRNSLIINCISCYDSHVLTDRNRCNPQIHGCDSNSITLKVLEYLGCREVERKNLRAREVLQNLFESSIPSDNLLRAIRLFNILCPTCNNLVKRDDGCVHVRITNYCNSFENVSAVFAPVALQDAKVIRVENKHQPYSSFRISVCRSSRPNRRISAKSGSSLNEPSILAIHPGFFAARSILLDCESLRRVTSFSNCSSRSSTVAIYISKESNKTRRSIVPCSSSKGKGRKDAI